MSNHIYAVTDNTGECNFYVNFFKKKENAIKELKKQMNYAQIEFGMTDLKFMGEQVKKENKVVFEVLKHTLN